MNHFITDYNIDCPAGAESAALEDSIMQKGRPVTAGSKILGNFISPLDATVVSRLEAAGVYILGKTKMDEFGISGLFADELPVTSGAVSAVAESIAAFALCNDYTGTVGQQAAAHGLYYIHPTYGTISRFGLIPAVPSIDQIGIVCKTPAEGFRILAIIAGHDPKDGAMYANSEFGIRNSELTEKLTIGVPENIFAAAQGSDSSKSFIGLGVGGNFDTVSIELKYFEVYAQVMRILCCAEISANISRYDGIKFGYRAEGFLNLQELYKKSRTEGFGQYAKLVAIIGAMVLSQENYMRYYDKAMRIRRLIMDSLEFDKYDAIVLPAFGTAADFKLAQGALPRLCGLPSVTMPIGGGIMFVADKLREDVLEEIII